MPAHVIQSVRSADRRFTLHEGAGTDAVHPTTEYAYAVCHLRTGTAIGTAHEGTGLAFTLGAGNDLVCRAIDYLAEPLVGREIEDLMANFAATYRALADSPTYRWLGPHKGVTHLALAALVNACFDLWAKTRGLPLWRLLLDLSPEALVALLDLSYLDDELTRDEALAMLRDAQPTRAERAGVLQTGYRGYDTSVGWFNNSDEKIRENTRRAVDAGFTALKLKVGSDDPARDLRRAALVRQTAGDAVTLMLDANQKWSLPQALRMGLALADIRPYWLEEPTHPDDVLAHRRLVEALAPVRVAAGEHIPNKVIFKNFLQANALHFCQVDAVRVGGVAEFLAVSLLAKKFGVPVVPHVGDMGQLHQHLVLFNHVALGHEALFLEHIPHLRPYFRTPARLEDGVYQTPQEAGSSCDLVD